VKSRILCFLSLAIGMIPKAGEACSVCFGNPESATTQAARAGILFLLVVTGLVLAGFSWTFLTWAHRSKILTSQDTHPHL